MSKKIGRTVDEMVAEVRPDPKVTALQHRVDELEGAIQSRRLAEGELGNLIAEVTREVPVLAEPPRYYKPPASQKTVSQPTSAVLHYTDWHYGAVQRGEEIEGFNAFSPEIATQRVKEGLVPAAVEMTELLRASYMIPELVIPVTGDVIQGELRRGDTCTMAFARPVQAVGAARLMSDSISMLAPHFERVRVEFICADNHGRLTTLPETNDAGLNNFNYVIGEMMRERLKEHRNVELNVYTSLTATIKVRGWGYLLMHGHDIRGWMGFPYYGMQRRVGLEAIKRMNRPDNVHFHGVWLGHWHAELLHPWYQIGGSLSGTTAYDHTQGRESVPTQTFWIVHPKHRLSHWSPIRLDRWGGFDETAACPQSVEELARA